MRNIPNKVSSARLSIDNTSIPDLLYGSSQDISDGLFVVNTKGAGIKKEHPLLHNATDKMMLYLTHSFYIGREEQKKNDNSRDRTYASEDIR